MSGQVNLDAAPLGLKAVREQSRLELQELLDAIPGRKLLVLDETLTGPLGLVVEVSLLKARGVERIYHLLPAPLETDCECVVYVVRPHIELMHLIASQVRGRAREPNARTVVIFVPQRSMICEKVLEEAFVYDLVSVREFAMDMVPLDVDLVSLENECFAECNVHGVHLSLLQLARSLVKLQAASGPFALIRGKGESAKTVVELMRSLQTARDASIPGGARAAAAAAGGAGATLVVLDRRADLVTPMLTQLTYEGLLDETFEIKHSFVDVDPALLAGTATAAGGSASASGSASAGSERKIKLSLNSNDSLYAEIRDVNFARLHALLRSKAEEIRDGYEQRHAAQTVSQMRGFMKKLGSMQQQHKSLATHINMAQALTQRTSSATFRRQLEHEQSLLANGGETALLGSGGAIDACADFVEEMIGKAEPLPRVLRLLCLMSLVGNGLKQRQLDFFRTELLQTYGYELGFTLDRLESAGLLRRSEARSSWPSLRSALRLIVDGSDEANPTDVAHIFSGYAPVSVRLVQQAVSGQWLGLEDALRMLPGPLFEVRPQTGASPQRPSPGVSPPRLSYGNNAIGDEGEAEQREERPVVLVVFVGGCTYAEVSALRWISRRPGASRRYMVLTTHMCSGTSLMAELIDKVENNLAFGPAGSAA